MWEPGWTQGVYRRFYRKPKTPFRILGERFTLIMIILLTIAAIFWIFHKDHIKDDVGDDFTYLDSLYFTIVTITTLGYGDIVPITTEARMFDALIITPIRLFVWILFIGTAYQLVFQRYWERFSMEKKVKNLNGHIIIAGYDAVGMAAADELLAKGYHEDNLLVIDKRDEFVKSGAEAGATGVLGDPTKEEILLKAGIKGAKILIIATDHDDTNVLTTLTAKDLNQNIKVISSVSQAENIKQLKRAGADVIISPSLSGGHLMAMAVSTSQSVELIEELLTTSRGANIIQRKVKDDELKKKAKDFKKSIVIGIIRHGKKIGPTELDGVVLKQGDEVIIIE
jgi:voltage-gated potassium channel